jgi:hypothetical protein
MATPLGLEKVALAQGPVLALAAPEPRTVQLRRIRELFSVMDLTTFRTWEVATEEPSGVLTLELQQPRSDAVLKLTIRRDGAGQWHIVMPGTDQLVAARKALVAGFGANPPTGQSFKNLQSARDAMRTSGGDEQLQGEVDRIGDWLEAAGFEHYEVSNFAKPKGRCRHNEAYWDCRPWEAFGPGAARFDGRTRITNHRSTTTWMNKVLAGADFTGDVDAMTAEDAARGNVPTDVAPHRQPPGSL